MFGSQNKIDDSAIRREEQALRELLAPYGTEDSSALSDAYWQMFPQRVMSRIHREKDARQRGAWNVWWKPAVSLSTISAAVVAFLVLRATPVTLDQVTASLSPDELQTVEQTQDGVAPFSANEQTDVSDIADQVKSANSDDLDAELTLGDVDPSEVESTQQPELPVADQTTIENMSDQDADAVIQSLKTSL